MNKRPLWLRSRTYTWAALAGFPVDMSFLERAIRRMEHAEVLALLFVFRGSVTAGAGTAFGEDGARIFQHIDINDNAGSLFAGSGANLRAIGQMELGSRYYDPADIATTVTNASYSLTVPFIFHPLKAYDGEQFRVPATALLDGNGIEVTFNDATPAINTTVNSGTFQLIAIVVDNGKQRLWSRMIWRDIPMNADEDDYAVGGRLRAAFCVAPAADATGGYTSWASNLTASVPELDYALQNRDVLDFWAAYNSEIPNLSGMTNIFRQGEAFPLFLPTAEHTIAEMPHLGRMRVELHQARPADARLMLCVLPDRNVVKTADALRFASPGALQSAVAVQGKVLTRSGSKPIGQVKTSLLRNLAIELDASGGGGGIGAAIQRLVE